MFENLSICFRTQIATSVSQGAPDSLVASHDARRSRICRCRSSQSSSTSRLFSRVSSSYSRKRIAVMVLARGPPGKARFRNVQCNEKHINIAWSRWKSRRASDSGLNTYFIGSAQQVFAARAQTYQTIIHGRRCSRLARRTRLLLRDNNDSKGLEIVAGISHRDCRYFLTPARIYVISESMGARRN